MRLTIGIMLAGSPIWATFAAYAYLHGFLATAMVFGGTVALLGLMGYGVYLIVS